jgi:pimeloyl-ACP methyl ester carboxylesterase
MPAISTLLRRRPAAPPGGDLRRDALGLPALFIWADVIALLLHLPTKRPDEPPMGFLKSPPSLVHRLEALLAAGERDELLALFLRDVAGLLSDQIELMRSLPAWEARLAAAPTLPREERATREYAFDPDRFRALRVPTLLLLGSESPAVFRAAGEAVQAALPDCRIVVMPGQRHVAMDTGTELFTGEVLRFLGE